MARAARLNTAAAAAAAALLAVACSGGAAEPAADMSLRPDSTIGTAPASDTADQPTVAAASDDTTGSQNADTGAAASDEQPHPDPALQPPTVTVTDGPVAMVQSRDDAGEDGLFTMSFAVSDPDAVCGLSLIGADGTSALQETRALDETGAERDIEVAFAVEAGNMPIYVRLGCASGDSAETVIGPGVMIVDAEEPSSAAVAKKYENRSPDSVFPASDAWYFDHDEIRAAFPDCPPAARWQMPAWFVEWAEIPDALYAGWDTEATVLRDGNRVATGWWTDENLAARWDPAPTAAEARQSGVIGQSGGFSFWGTSGVYVAPPDWYYSPWDAPDAPPDPLFERLVDEGYTGHNIAPFRWVRDTGIVPHRQQAGFDEYDTGLLLFRWMRYRYQLPPVDREPTAWAMRTLLEARGPECVAVQMLWACDLSDPMTHPYLSSPHMRNDEHGSRLGLALWSIVCGEGPRS